MKFYKDPRFKHGANAILLTLGVIAGVILVNMIITGLSSKATLKFDFTQNSLFDFSPETNDLLKNLNTPVDVYAFYSGSWDSDKNVRQVKEYLDRYRKGSSNFRLQYVDPEKNPAIALKFQQSGESISGGSIVLQSGSRIKTISIDDMFTSQQDQSSQGPCTQSIQVEQKITSALLYVTTGAGTKAYIVGGHGRDTAQDIKTALTGEDYAVSSLNLLAGDVPDDASVILMPNPERDLSNDEVNKLDKYFDKGGKGVFLFMAGLGKLPNLENYLSEWGVQVNDDLVIEHDSNKFMNPYPYILFPDMQSHDITSKLLNQSIVFVAPQSSSLTLKSGNPQNATVTSLLKTSDKSFGMKNYQNAQQFNKAPDDAAGPLDVCALSTRDTPKGSISSSASILVMGASQAFTAQFMSNSGTANSDFMLNAFAWLTNKKGGMDIRPKDITPGTLFMTQSSFIVVLLLALLLTLLIAVMGFVVWFRRRYK